MANFDNIQPVPKIKTGIEGFDGLAMGGIPGGRPTLVAGSSGSGKTIFGVEFLWRGITQFGRTGVFVSFEEKADDVVRNVKRLGWNLDESIKENKLIIIDASHDTNLRAEVGKYDLSGLLAQLRYAIEKVDAQLVVMDSIGSLFSHFSDECMIRDELFRIGEELKERNVTAILTAERLDEYGRISRYGVEEFVSDNVIVLRNILMEEKCRRTIQILKFRGDTHTKGEYPFTISDSGISILPISSMELKQSSTLERIQSGNIKLDSLSGGGFFRDSIILVSGPTGAGKSLMGTTFTAAGCRNKERVLLLAFEESREQLLRNAQGWGMDFRQWEESGLLKVICAYPESVGLEDHLLNIRREIDAFKPHRLVVDSISAMERVSTVRNFREFVIALTSYTKHENICGLFTCTTPKLSGGESVTEAHISTITDAIMVLRYVEMRGSLRRGLAVIKMRGSQHDKNVYEYSIDSEGLHLGNQFTSVQNIILGLPSTISPSESDELGEMFKE